MFIYSHEDLDCSIIPSGSFFRNQNTLDTMMPSKPEDLPMEEPEDTPTRWACVSLGSMKNPFEKWGAVGAAWDTMFPAPVKVVDTPNGKVKRFEF